jgi:hypothetical protein
MANQISAATKWVEKLLGEALLADNPDRVREVACEARRRLHILLLLEPGSSRPLQAIVHDLETLTRGAQRLTPLDDPGESEAQH